jgi:signal peptidase
VLGIAILVPLAVLMSTVLLLGWQLQVIETASMEPRVPAGSLAVVQPIDVADVRPGMVIVFEDPARRGRLVAHRAVKPLPDDGAPVWETKGDANRTADPYPVHAPAISGRVRWSIPRLGDLVSTLDRPATPVILIGLPLALLGATELMSVRRRRARNGGSVLPDAGSATVSPARVYAILDPTSDGSDAFGSYVGVFLRREEAETFVHDVRGHNPGLANALQIVERGLDAGIVDGTMTAGSLRH